MDKKKPGFLSIWTAQIRANFLLLAVLLVCIGLAYTYKFNPASSGSFSWIHAILVMAGAVFSHISVNLFNEYFDFISGVDLKTKRTPFSGGSGMLVRGYTKPGTVLAAAVSFLLAALVIGIYFTVVSHPVIAFFVITGGLTIVLYNGLLSRLMLGELFAGLTLGTFVVLGTYIAMTANPGMPVSETVPLRLLLLSIPPGILTSLLLLLNEFPDAEADKTGGRKHIVVRLGKRKAAYVYVAGIFLTFGTILFLPIAGMASGWIFLALLPLPLAMRSAVIAVRHNRTPSLMVTAQGNIVATVLGTDFLLALAILI